MNTLTLLFLFCLSAQAAVHTKIMITDEQETFLQPFMVTHLEMIGYQTCSVQDSSNNTCSSQPNSALTYCCATITLSTDATNSSQACVPSSDQYGFFTDISTNLTYNVTACSLATLLAPLSLLFLISL